MSTLLSFHDIFDQPYWRPTGVSSAATIAGSSLAWDMRNNEMRHPELFFITSAALFNKCGIKAEGWLPLTSPALTGVFGIGAQTVFAPSQGPSGTIAAGATTSQITLTTALPAAVGLNQLADRGDGLGFSIRIIGNSAGGSGKTEEVRILANTAGTTPTITLTSALTFTPALGDGYQLLSGRVYLLSAGLLAAGSFKYYDIATNSYSGNLSITNLPASITTGTNLVCSDESYTPYTRQPGEGYLVGAATYNNGLFGCLQATGSGATSLTGQASSGDASIVLNEYRNFQIRIVEDTGTPTSVGQRRNITSATAGASPVYTVATWTVTPSTTAKYVIEQNTDRILCWTTASTSTFTYLQSANTWDTTSFGVRGGAVSSSPMSWLASGIVKDVQGNVNPGMIYSFRGGVSTTLDVLDITAGTTGVWSNAVTYGNLGVPIGAGCCAAYLPSVNNGRYAYITATPVSGIPPNIMRFDSLNRVLEPYSQRPLPDLAPVEGQKMATTTYIDGGVKVGWVYSMRNTATDMFINQVTR